MLSRCTFAAATLTLTLAATTLAQGREHYQAFAVNLSNIGTSSPTVVDIVIERWSTEAEQARIAEAFQKSQDALLSTIQKIRPRVGHISRPGSGEVGWDLRYANKLPLEEGGSQIVILTDRRIGFREASERPRSIDYPFTLIELHLNEEGTGEGRASIATKITWDEKTRTLELENYASSPVQLTEVKKVE